MVNTDKLIHNGDFCEVVTDKFIHENVKRGHVVYVAGHKALPEDESDPYTQRIKFLVHLYNPIQKSMSKELYLVDPISILPLKKHESEQYLEQYKLANGID